MILVGPSLGAAVAIDFAPNFPEAVQKLILIDASVYFAILYVLQRFFFKSQVIAANKFNIGKCDDFAWVTKDELLEYFPEHAEYLNKMIIS